MSPPIDPSDLARVIADLREGVQVIGPDWRYLYVNAAAAAQGRTTEAALLGRTMTECYPGIDATPMFARLRRCLETGAPDAMTNEFTYPDGRTAHFDLRFQRVEVGVVVLSIDVTQQRQLELGLQRSVRMEALGRLAGG